MKTKLMGQRIHDKRKENGLTQEELGKKLIPAVTRQSICKWEIGETSEIKRDYIGQMAAIFKVDPVWLMGLENIAEVQLTYKAEGKEPVKVTVESQNPIIGPSSLRAQLYQVAMQVAPENLQVAIGLLKSLI